MLPLHSVLRGPKARARAGVSLRARRAHRHASQHGLPLRVEALEDRRLLSVAPSLLADIAVGVGSRPGWFVDVDGVAYFSAGDGTPGAKLWKTDGTATGTELVKSIDSGRINWPQNVNGTLFFWTESELWTSDGTEQGTVTVKEFARRPTAAPGTVVNGALMFGFDTGLWKSDGTEQGTVLVKSFADHSGLGRFTSVSGTLFFTVTDNDHGKELWKSDGTEQGTMLVKDIWTDGGSTPEGLVNVNGTLFFNAFERTHGRELWKSDGTEEGTVLVKDVTPGSGSSDFGGRASVDGTLIFAADDGTHGKELWRSDGTEQGTMRISDINPGGGSSIGRFSLLSNVGGTIFFWADNGTDGYAVWKSDGTEQGTLLVKDIRQGDGATPFLPLFSGGFTSLEGEAFFPANDGTTGYELWKSDGTEQGTVLVKQVGPGPLSGSRGFVNIGGTLFFRGNDVVHGPELWKSDGTAEGTVLVKDINPETTESSTPESFTVVGSLTFFVARTPSSGQELWRTDGTQAGTFPVTDLFPGETGSSPRFLTNVDGVLYFTAFDRDWDPFVSFIPPIALFKSDGTAEGTVRVKQLLQNRDSGPRSMIDVNGRLFLDVETLDERGRRASELWTSDGTEEGTLVLADARGPFSPVNVNGTVFFNNRGFLWKTDGINTAPVGDDPAGVRVGRLLSNFNGTLYFTGFDDTNGIELWKTDGTAQGTALVKDINPGIGLSVDDTFESAAVDGELFFHAVDESGDGLWKSDGTEEGTVLVKRDVPGSGYLPMVNVSGTLFFQADDDEHGREWWTSDGTEAGTFLLKDVNPGPADGALSAIFNDSFSADVNDTFYFVANDGTRDALWMSDGTPAGTVPVDDGGTTLLDPNHLANVNGTLYFSADDGVHGDEPWIFAPEVVPGLFYNNAGGDDDALEVGVPLAHDKLPYYAGDGTAAFENISNYVHGINGINVDLPADHGPLTADDFTFKIGSGNDPQTWTTGPSPTGISVLPGAGVAGKDRVQIVWPDGAIKNTWLQVMVKGNDAAGGFHTNTGLETSTIFYFGSRVGDVGQDSSPVAFLTTAADQIEVRRHAGPTTPTTARYDFDQNGLIDAADELIARQNIGFLRRLEISPEAAEVVFARDESASSAIATALAAPRESEIWDVQPAANLVATPLAATTPLRITESPRQPLADAFTVPARSLASDLAHIDLTLDEELLDSLLPESALP